jgi:hypothetical protein
MRETSSGISPNPDADPGDVLTVAWAWGLGAWSLSNLEGGLVSEKRKYRTFTPEQKLEIVLAGDADPGDRSDGQAAVPRSDRV